MKRLRIAVAAAVLTAAFLCPQPAVAATRAEQWRALAVSALDEFERVDTGRDPVATYAYAAEATARLHGWDDPRVAALLARVYAKAKPDGGYGLDMPFDTHSNGTVNPASTTYTVTLAGHVGPVLLAGYRAGVVPRDRVKRIVDLLMGTPRIPSAAGQCLAYSRHPNDVVSYGCVHNVTAGAAAFLLRANEAGVGAAGLNRLVVDITRREVSAYQPVISGRLSWWRYMDTRLLNDADHNSYSAESAYRLAYPIGREAAYQHMVTAWADNDAAPIAHLRLTSLPRTAGGEDWCALGDRWLAEATTYINDLTTAGRLAQAAQLAARNADAC